MKKFFIFLIINFILWGPFLVVKNLTQAAAFPTVTPEILRQNPNYLFTYIQDLYNFGLGIVGMLALVMIVFGAVQYAVMSAASPDKKRDALNRIYSALWGLLLLFGAYLILTTINPQLITLQISGATPTTPVAEPAPQHSFCGAGYKDFQKRLAECKKNNNTDNDGTKHFVYLFYTDEETCLDAISFWEELWGTMIWGQGPLGEVMRRATKLEDCRKFPESRHIQTIQLWNNWGILVSCLPFKTVEPSGKAEDYTEYFYANGQKICTK